MSIQLIDESRAFSTDELFFSTTDSKGLILRANLVFQRIAGYSWDELRNQPHKIVRHPDMPRVVFKLLWKYIQAGRPIVAYVKNLAHDGRYYWVTALVAAIPGGYLSVRFKPTSELLGTVEGLYKTLRAAEAAIEAESGDRKAAMAASGELLNESLRALGFAGYDDFMRQVLKREMQSRESEMLTFARNGSKDQEVIQSSELDSLRTVALMFDRLVEILNDLFKDLEGYVDISKVVRAKSGSLTDISESLRVSALNGAIAVDVLGSKAAGLRPVLNSLRALSAQITSEGRHLSASLDELVKDVEVVVFDLCAAKLQIEMTAQFAHELVSHLAGGVRDGSTAEMTEGAIGSLHASASFTVRRALDRLAALKDRLKILEQSQDRLLEASHSLRPIYLTGRIELADGAGPKLVAVFKDLGEHTNEAVENLGGLRGVLESLEAHLAGGLAHGERIKENLTQIDSHMSSVTQLSR